MPGSSSALEILSAAPWFDDKTAAALLQVGLPEPEASNQYEAIRRSGALLYRNGLWRVPDPLRSELRTQLHARDEEFYAEILHVYGRHSSNGMAQALSTVLGRSGAAVTTEVLNYVSESGTSGVQSHGAFNRLQDLVYHTSSRPPADVARDVARLLGIYGVGRSRAMEFFLGLSHWNRNERVEAVAFFDVVLRERANDTIAAIAGHLVGVFEYAMGNIEEARAMVEAAITILRSLGDIEGLAVTLSTLGRIERGEYRSTGEKRYIEASITALEEAETISVGSTRSRSLELLAKSYADHSRFDDARAAAQEAARIAPSGEDGVAARMTLALVERADGDFVAYSRAIEDALQIAERDRVEGLRLASLLNMAATSQRSRGDLPAAEGLARRSLAMGRRLRDRRHIAHSAHTLAGILVDAASHGAEVDLDEALALLEESRLILVHLRDTRGVRLVDETSTRFTSVARDDGDTSIAAF